MFIIFTGNGKGKTTAALGQALRAIGNGKRVLMVQFIKGPWRSGEDISSKKLSPDFRLVKMGKGFVGIMGDALPREEHRSAARRALGYITKEAKSGKWDMVICDEINNAVRLNLISARDALHVAGVTKRKGVHIIFTGRDAPESFLKRADLVSEMREVKHPFRKGVQGRGGLEY